jgi:hypothetical protein
VDTCVSIWCEEPNILHTQLKSIICNIISLSHHSHYAKHHFIQKSPGHGGEWREHICLLSGFPPFCTCHLLGRVDTKKRQKECMGHRDLVFLPFSSRVVHARGLCFFLCFHVENSLKTVENRTGGRRGLVPVHRSRRDARNDRLHLHPFHHSFSNISRVYFNIL